MNPARIERIVRIITGREATVTENGTYLSYFRFAGESMVDYRS